jgi:hypothetical protein
MLKKPIKLGRVYLDRTGKKRGPLELIDGRWWDQFAMSWSANGVPLGADENHPYALVSRVKTPKAKPAKAKKWLKCWAVAEDLYETKEKAKCAAIENSLPIHRAKVSLRPEPPDPRR